jgi:hypothetical protein
MNFTNVFIEAVSASTDIPAALRVNAPNVTALEEHRFDSSYIEFLDTQIDLSPRGPEWTERLKRRRTALLPFCDVMLLRGNVEVNDVFFTVEIDPATRTVIHWEEYER